MGLTSVDFITNAGQTNFHLCKCESDSEKKTELMKGGTQGTKISKASLF